LIRSAFELFAGPRTIYPVSVRAQIAELAEHLTPAERRVAEFVDREPDAVAFSTVTELAERADAGVATVARLAAKLGFDGFRSMQDAIRAEMTERLRPAAERIREPSPRDLVGQTLAVELANLRATLGAISSDDVDRAAAAIAKAKRSVMVLSGDASAGVARQIANDLSMLRPGVFVADGNPIALTRQTHEMGSVDVCVVLDLRRYETWVVETARQIHGQGVVIVALTDGPLSPLMPVATHAFVVAADSAGPFDSYVATLALGSALTTAVAGRLKGAAAERLDRLEKAWNVGGLLE
jgi:DNA-binding MurR/RpiR family transcriptional regulator